MKKVIIALVAMFMAFNAHAQLGIVGGVTSSATNLNDAYTDIAKSMSVTQYHAGIVYNLNLPLGLSVQPGIVYNMKGQSLQHNLGEILNNQGIPSIGLNGEEIAIDTKTGYLEVPVRVAFSLDLGPIKPFVFAEPFLGYAITTETKSQFKDEATKRAVAGLVEATGLKLDTSKDDPNKWSGRDRLEYGVGIGAGVKVFNMLALSAKYYWDMGNVYSGDSDKASISAKHMYNAVKSQKCSGISASLTLYF